METKETKNCPYCGEEILAVAKKCKHCGEWLPEPSQPKKMVPCPICGEEVEEGTAVCPHCKENIDGTTEPEQERLTVSPVPTSSTSRSNSVDNTPNNLAPNKEAKGNNNWIWIAILAVFIVIVGIAFLSNMSDKADMDAEVKAEADRVNAVTEQIERGEEIEGYVEPAHADSWKKDYRQDEFGNKDNSHPYIYQIWSGRRDDSFDCGLGILVCNDYIQLTITEEYIDTNLAGATVTGQLNGNKFQINYDQAENESVYIANSAEAKKLLQALETDGTLMLAFRRTDSFDKTHIWLFTIHGSTNVIGAMQKFLNDN